MPPPQSTFLMKIAIPSLVNPAASIAVQTASHGPFAVRLVDCGEGRSKRVIALSTARAGSQNVSNDIPANQVSRWLFDGFDVNTETRPDLATEIVNALIAVDQARIVS